MWCNYQPFSYNYSIDTLYVDFEDILLSVCVVVSNSNVNVKKMGSDCGPLALISAYMLPAPLEKY